MNTLKVSSAKTLEVPLHLVIGFKPDYPASPPSAGFLVHWPYRNGASTVGTVAGHAGAQTICLDILGNYSDIHTEWKNEKGSGWSPAYSVSTLLLNLQALLLELDSDLSEHEKRDLHRRAMQFRCAIFRWAS